MNRFCRLLCRRIGESLPTVIYFVDAKVETRYPIVQQKSYLHYERHDSAMHGHAILFINCHVGTGANDN